MPPRPQRSYGKWEQKLVFKTIYSAEELSEIEKASIDLIPVTTRREWTEKFKKYGMIPLDWKEFKKTRPRRTGTHTMTQAIDETLRRIVLDHNGDLFLDQIQDKLYEATTQHFSLSAIDKALHERLDMLGLVKQ